jgi:5-formyltetrahydrofolate cyclo-ligase
MTKNEIRAYIKKKKAELSQDYIQSYSEKVCRILTRQDFYLNSKVIYPYIAYNQEIRTQPLIEDAWSREIEVAVPKVVGKDMNFIRLHTFDQLKLGYCGIPEPENGEVKYDEKLLMLMPGLAFDRDFNRIGYGGGFYDRYLEKMSSCRILKVAFAYDFQMLDHIETEEHDYKIDVLITADGCIAAPTAAEFV